MENVQKIVNLYVFLPVFLQNHDFAVAPFVWIWLLCGEPSLLHSPLFLVEESAADSEGNSSWFFAWTCGQASCTIFSKSLSSYLDTICNSSKNKIILRLLCKMQKFYKIICLPPLYGVEYTVLKLCLSLLSNQKSKIKTAFVAQGVCFNHILENESVAELRAIYGSNAHGIFQKAYSKKSRFHQTCYLLHKEQFPRSLILDSIAGTQKRAFSVPRKAIPRQAFFPTHIIFLCFLPWGEKDKNAFESDTIFHSSTPV